MMMMMMTALRAVFDWIYALQVFIIIIIITQIKQTNCSLILISGQWNLPKPDRKDDENSNSSGLYNRIEHYKQK